MKTTSYLTIDGDFLKRKKRSIPLIETFIKNNKSKIIDLRKNLSKSAIKFR